MANYNILMNRWNGSQYDALLPKNSLTGITDPTTSTVGIVGQFYLNTTSEIVFVCVEANGGSYIWEKSSGLLPQINVTTNGTEQPTVICTDGVTTLTSTFVDKKCSFIIPNYGTWTISATLVGAVQTTQVIVDTVKIYETQLLGLDSVLNNNTWEDIKTASDLSVGANYWSVGDAKQIHLQGTVGSVSLNNDFWVYILGFNHNASKEGNNRIHFGFGRTEQNYSSTNGIALVDSQYYGTEPNEILAFTMNTTATNVGGWNDCHMRNTILGSSNDPSSPTAKTFMSVLPSDLRNVLKTRTTYTSSGGGQNTIQQITDYVWLLAEFEVFGERVTYSSFLIERSYLLQYQYYINGNTENKNKYNAFDVDCMYWLRSPSDRHANAFVAIEKGYIMNMLPYYSCGVAPVFCV